MKLSRRSLSCNGEPEKANRTKNAKYWWRKISGTKKLSIRDILQTIKVKDISTGLPKATEAASQYYVSCMPGVELKNLIFSLEDSSLDFIPTFIFVHPYKKEMLLFNYAWE